MHKEVQKTPTVSECYDLMVRYRMLPNIKDHSIVVARVAEVITTDLKLAGQDLSLDKTIAGALLHDIGKTACLDNDDDHAAKGVEICRAHDFGTVAEIVGEHVILKNYTENNRFTEKEIVYYADKRVNHDQVVNLEERLAYILERYGRNNIARCQAIKRNYALCQKLEKRIFSFLEFAPADMQTLIITRESSF